MQKRDELIPVPFHCDVLSSVVLLPLLGGGYAFKIKSPRAIVLVLAGNLFRPGRSYVTCCIRKQGCLCKNWRYYIESRHNSPFSAQVVTLHFASRPHTREVLVLRIIYVRVVLGSKRRKFLCSMCNNFKRPPPCLALSLPPSLCVSSPSAR